MPRFGKESAYLGATHSKVMHGFGFSVRHLTFFPAANSCKIRRNTPQLPRLARNKSIGHLEVTPFIANLARSIPIEDDYSDEQIFAQIIKFIHKDFKVFQNIKALLALFKSSLKDPEYGLSVEDTNTLLQRAIAGELSSDDRRMIQKGVKITRRVLGRHEQHFLKNKKKYTTIIAKLGRLPHFHPLKSSLPPDAHKLIKMVGRKTFFGVWGYLRYRTRLKSWTIMNKAALTATDKRTLASLNNYGIAPYSSGAKPKTLIRSLSKEALLDGAYKLYLKNYDHYFSFPAHLILKHKMGTGCGHAAMVFMALSKALGISDVRLVSMVMNHSYNNKHCQNGKLGKPVTPHNYVDGHKMVLVRIRGRYALINTTQYPLEIIDITSDSKRIYPETLVGKDVIAPSFIKKGKLNYAMMRVRSVGSDNYDYLNIYTAKADRNVSLTGYHDNDDVNCLDYPLPTLEPTDH